MSEHDCQQWLGQLSDYVDGDLAEGMCQEIRRHMQDCQNCRVVVDTLRKTVSLYRVQGQEPTPENVEDRLLHVLNLDDFKL